MEKRNQWKPDCICPVCGQYKFAGIGDICNICFWENDDVQYENPDLNREACGGANRVSLNAYRKWWNRLERLMPYLIKKYEVSYFKNNQWKYEKLKVCRKYRKEFVEELLNNDINLEHSWYCINILTEGEC